MNWGRSLASVRWPVRGPPSWVVRPAATLTSATKTIIWGKKMELCAKQAKLAPPPAPLRARPSNAGRPLFGSCALASLARPQAAAAAAA